MGEREEVREGWSGGRERDGLRKRVSEGWRNGGRNDGKVTWRKMEDGIKDIIIDNTDGIPQQ